MDNVTLDLDRLNDAKWAACNTDWSSQDCMPTMEMASEVAVNAVLAYLGLDKEDFKELFCD
jgi:hypothetical protein